MKKPDRYFYPAVFSRAPGEAEISVVFPDLDVATSGVNDQDALLSARDLLGCVLYGLEEDGAPIPTPTPLTEVTSDPSDRIALVDVYMPTIRDAQNTKSVSRTVTLPAWLNAAAAEVNINFSQVLQEALKQRLHRP